MIVFNPEIDDTLSRGKLLALAGSIEGGFRSLAQDGLIFFFCLRMGSFRARSIEVLRISYITFDVTLSSY